MANNSNVKTGTIAFRIDGELSKKIDIICKTENKSVSSVAYDACLIYANIYPYLHALKSKKLYPELILNEEVIKEEIFSTLKHLL